MEPPSSIPVRSSGIPRPTSRLPVPKPSNTTSRLRAPSPLEQLGRRPPLSSSGPRPAPTAGPGASAQLQKKPSRTSLAHRSVTAPAIRTAPSTSSSRLPPTSTARRTTPATTTRAPSDAALFKKPVGRPAPRPGRIASQPSHSSFRSNTTEEEDELGDLDAFHSATVSRASSRADAGDEDLDSPIDGDTTIVDQRTPRKQRMSLADRTIESLQHVPSSPAGTKFRRQSGFYNAETSMPPPARPPSASGEHGRPRTSDGTKGPSTPRRLGGTGYAGSLTVPGKRTVSANAFGSAATTPSRTLSAARSTSHLRENISPIPSPFTNKPGSLRTQKSRNSLVAPLGVAVSPPGRAQPVSPTPTKGKPAVTGAPSGVRKVSNSSTALRDSIAKAKAARKAEAKSPTEEESPKKANSSSNSLREQIAKAKAAKRTAGKNPPQATSGDAENIQPDAETLAEFDFGLDDPFNQQKPGKSVLQRRVNDARLNGRLNLAAMGLDEIPDAVLTMYKFDPNDTSFAWGEVVDISTIVAADNNLETVPESMFPDVDYEMLDYEDDGPQFGSVQSIDLHGNLLRQLPLGLGRLPQLSKLNLSRNKLSMPTFDVVCSIKTLRELKLAENELEGPLPASLGELTQLETLELQGNKITSLPAEIHHLANLRSLNISENKVKDLPIELFTSGSLIELIANKNAFGGCFFNIGSVPHLQHLQLANNSIQSLSETEEIQLPALKTLNLSGNRLSSLPVISSWTSLTNLMVAENKLTAFPDGFTSLHQLRIADFTGNDISKLDEKIALMEGLDNLTLAANPLRERKFISMTTEDLKRDMRARLQPDDLDSAVEEEHPLGAEPTEIGWQLTPSGTLDLSSQALAQLDEEAFTTFAASNDIRQLNLQQNAFTSIPAVLADLAHLTVLDLSKNALGSDIFVTAIHLPKLKELRLANNKLTSLAPLLTHLTAPNLQTLNVANNRIAGPLPHLAAVFPNLIVLNASDNSISDVSADALKGLKIVNLGNNEIARLEPRIGLLGGTGVVDGLKSLEVEGNRFRVPNYTVLRKGTEAVLSWLRNKVPAEELEGAEGAEGGREGEVDE